MSLTQKIGQVIALSTLIFGSFTTSAFSATVPQEKAQETKSETLLAQSLINANNFKHEINSCRRKDREVVCELLVTNTSNSTKWIVFEINGSRAVSLYGDTYNLQKIVFGKTSVTRNTRYKAIKDTLTPGIPIKLNYHFTIPQGVSRLAGIELQLFSYSYYRIGFRNISIKNNSGGKRKCTCE